MKLGSALFFFLLLIGCQKSAPFQSAPQKRVFRWITSNDCRSLDWTVNTSPECIRQLFLIHEGLIRIKKEGEKDKIENALMENATFINPLQLQIQIKKNISWSNGADLKVIHFVLAWKKLLAHGEVNEFTRPLFSIKNAKAFSLHKVPFSKVGIQIIDSHTLLLDLDTPSEGIVKAFAHPTTFPILFEIGPTPFVSIGPFILKQKEFGKTAVFIPNPNYYGESKPVFDIEMSFLEKEKLTYFLSLFENKPDLIDSIETKFLEQLPQNSNIQFRNTNQVISLMFNPLKRPIDQLNLRKALVLGLNVPEIPQLLRLNEKRAFRLLAGVNLSEQPSNFPTYNPEKALALVSSLTKPFSGDALLFGYLKKPVLAAVAENIQAQWLKNLNISTKLLPFSKDQNQDFVLNNFHIVLSDTNDSPTTAELEDTIINQEYRQLPLLITTSPYYSSDRFKGLTPLSLGGWDFREIRF